MLNSARIQEWTSSLTEKLNEQEWFQQIKSKWEELDPQSRLYLKVAGLAAAVLLLLILVFSFIWKVHSLKSELIEKRTLLSTIQSANDEMRRLKESMPASVTAGAEQASGWGAFLENAATQSGIDKSNFSVANEKAGASNDQSKETLMDVTVKHINAKQMVRFAFAIENGQRPMKIRNVAITAQDDLSGYIDATFSVSGFNLVIQQ